MIAEYLQSRPLLRIGTMIIAGIVTGRMVDTPLPLSLLVIAVLAMLLLAAVLRKRAMLSSLCIMAASLTLGTFLIRNSDASSHSTTIPLPFADNAVTLLQEQRSRLSQLYQQQGMEGDEYAIVAAMTLGEKERVGKDLKEVYSATGASHVFALSGMHLGIIFMLIGLILPMRRMPKTATALQLTAMWTYVVLVGFHPSILRAAVMLTTYALCRLMLRKPASIDVLLFAAVALLAVVPQWLFNVGFQMSFMAVVSIALFYKPLSAILALDKRLIGVVSERCLLQFHYRHTDSNAWKEEPLVMLRLIALQLFYTISQWVWGVLVLSFTAQLGVAPLIVHYFGRFSCYSLLTNLIVSPCALLIIALALLLFLCLFAGLLTSFVASLLTTVVRFLNDSLSFIASLPFATIDNISLNTIQTILVYVIIASVALLIRIVHRNRKT